MSWKEKVKEFGGGDFTFLSEDGECLMFVIVDDPVLLTGKYKGKPSEKIGCPVVTDDGFQLLIAGKRLTRKLAKHEKEFKTVAFIAIRHGEQNDINSTYELKVLDDKDRTKQLLDRAKAEYTPALLKDAIEAAAEVMQG